MKEWFIKAAPIRLKLLVSYGLMTLLVVASSLCSLFSTGYVAIIIQLCLIVSAATAGLAFRAGIAGSYVATVIRMEALASGDLKSPIAFTDYTDCVGRMTKAMYKFRDDAEAQIAAHQQSETVVESMAVSLRELAQGDLTADITADYPPSYEQLKQSFNAALASLRALISSVSQSAVGLRTGPMKSPRRPRILRAGQRAMLPVWKKHRPRSCRLKAG